MIFSAISLGFLINIVPILIWLNFYLRRDYRKEPIFWVIIALLVGIGVTPFVFAGEVGLFGFFDGLIRDNTMPKNFLLSVLIAPLIEEIAKFLPVYFFIFRKKAFYHLTDAMLFMIIAALGFAFIENSLVVSKDYLDNQFWASSVQITLMRFISSTLLHTLSSGLLGFFWAFAILKKKQKYFFGILGILSATTLHGLFNFFNLLVISSSTFTGVMYLVALIALLIIFAGIVLRDFEILNQIRIPIKEIPHLNIKTSGRIETQ